jgi:hypothetical protein
VSWKTAKEKFSYFEFPEKEFNEAVAKYEEQERTNDIEKLMKDGIVTASKQFFTRKGEKNSDIKYNVVGLCNLDGYLVDVWEIKNNGNITERGWAMFNDEDNACLVSSKKYSFKKSDVSTDFFGDKI